MQTLKKTLTNAKATALEATASVLKEYGIDKLDGTVISSITITPQKTKLKQRLNILDERSLMAQGYFKPVLDVDAIQEMLESNENKDEIKPYVHIETSKEITPAKIKVNTKRTSVNNQPDDLLSIENKQVA
ncbi:MAG: hypothetical protein ACQERD_03870 [Campylobacterota bacterium]